MFYRWLVLTRLSFRKVKKIMERENLLKEINNVCEELFYSNAFEEQRCSSEERVLWLIEKAGGSINPKQLSDIMNVTMPRITTILNGMDNKGLIERQTSTQDRRKVIVMITKKGRAVNKKHKKMIEDCNKKVNEQATEAEMETILKYFKIFSSIQKEKDAVR